MAAARVYGEVDVRGAKVEAAGGELPLAEVVEKARKLWREVRAAGVSPADAAACDGLRQRLSDAHADFVASFPVVFRWMVDRRQFDAKAFELFLRRHVKVLYRDRHEFLAAQGEYLCLLHRALHPRAGEGALRRYRAAVEKALKEEDESFARAREEAAEEVERADAEADRCRRERLHAYLLRLREAAAAGSQLNPPPSAGAAPP